MASTYTDAGIELIGVGEQANTWGETTNTNLRLLEEMITGVVSISLNSTTSYNLTTTDGATSNGRHLVVQFTGSPGAAATVVVSPDDMQKVYFVDNSTDEPITLTQGSGGDVIVPAGTKKIVYCDGDGSGAKVTDLTEDLAFSGSITATDVTATDVTATDVTATDVTATDVTATDVTATGTLSIGSTWSVREDSGTLYFNSASGDVLTVDENGTLTTSGEIVVE